ncbi:hypothetical protein pipiens_011884 [Culex pipiens pipiens]|uniref:Endonuclease/exonuclease/phosphatase domain-containing protein n=1 Tax=Culex pipiens pipiens TaxID=38569 RepID=A0ABD1D4M3_CULPP
MEKRVRVNTLKVTFKRGSKEPTDAEMFQFCREQHFKPEEIYSVHKDKELGAIMIKLKNENLMRAAIQALQPSLLPGFLNRPLSETDSCQMTPLGKPVGGKQSPPDKPEVPVEPMEAAMEQSEGLTSPPSALQVQLVESPVFRPNLEPEGTPDQGKQPDQEGKWQLQGRKGRSKKRPESFSPGADTSKKLLRSQSLRSRSRSQRRHPKGVPETSEPQGALSTPDGQSDDQIFKKPLPPPSPSPEQQNGRILSIVCDDINLVNVYAHSGTNKKRERDDLFRDEITPHVIKGNCSHTVIGGDFNCVLNKRDSRSTSANLCQGLKDLTTSMHLKDVANVRNGSNVEFTFHRAGSASRLDRFYVSAQFLDKVVEIRTVPVAFSDHSAVVMKFLVDQSALCQRGRGYWKLNSSLLNKDDISCRYVVDFYQLKDREIYTRNRSTWWNTVVKPKTQFFFKNESRIFNCRINSAKSELYAKMYDLAAERRNGADNRNQLQEVKSELMRMELDRLKFYGSRFPKLRC